APPDPRRDALRRQGGRRGGGRPRGHALGPGRDEPGALSGVEKLRGDRTGELEALRGRSFDACIAVNARESEWVRRSLEGVDAPYYLFVSSVSAYADLSGPVDEDAPTHGPGEEYGQQKAEAERLVRERGGTVVRPGLIVGPNDPTGRFKDW